MTQPRPKVFMTSNAELQTAAYAGRDEQVQVLLVEDDDGDAVLVGELLREVGAAVVVQRARSLAQAKDLVPGAACVLLDLGLPDSQGLNGLRQLLQIEPEAAIVVLTGEASEHLGEQAVRAGAQDYLVKGEVAGHMLNRVIRYAVERRRAEGSAAGPARGADPRAGERPAGAGPAAVAAAGRHQAERVGAVPAGRQAPPARRRLLRRGRGLGRLGERPHRRRVRARPGRGRARRLPAGGLAHHGAGRPAVRGDPVHARRTA